MDQIESQDADREVAGKDQPPFDYTFVTTTARIALYDDLRSAPHVIEIPPAETSAYIEKLASEVYEKARNAGGSIPYTVIREVSENFIHARFKEIVVSVLDRGNTIRFADQGPGINHKDKAQLPGFSSAIEPMKKYIRGVGSGLPIVKEYLEFSHGNITIEDNMGTGSVVTISMNPEKQHGENASSGRPSDGYAADGHAAAAAQPKGPEGAAAWGNSAPLTASTAFSQPQASPSAAAQQGYAQAPYTALQNPNTAGGPAGAYPAPQNTAQLAAQQPAFNADVPGAAYSAAGMAPAYPGNATAGMYSAANAGGAYPGAGGGSVYPGAYDPALAAQFAAHKASRIQMASAPLSQRERDFLSFLLYEGPLGITEISQLSETPNSSTHLTLKKLEEAGLVERMAGNNKKRTLTPLGREVAEAL